MTLEPGVAVDALTLELEREAVPSPQVTSGMPDTGWVSIGVDAGGEWGVWELSAGGMTDTEVSEVFVVIAGAGVLEFLTPALPRVSLRPGVVMRLSAGMQTRWTISTPLRKVVLVAE